jgi:hypothetical protein
MSLLAANGSRIDFGDLAAIDGLTAITVAFTIKPTVSLANNRLVHKWGNAANAPAFLAQVIDTDNILFVVNNGAGTALRGDKTTDHPLAIGTLSRVVCRWRASDQEVNIWVNGAARTDTAVFNNTVSALGTTTASVQVGYESAEGVNPQSGDYSEFVIWNRYLTDDEVIQYGKGFSANFMRTGGILYAPLINANSLGDLWGGVIATNPITQGTTADHPSVYHAS